ncbi:MAG: CDP-diacylglycerol--glycerol-3-phosphate 3-phosphatidyltransferase [Actinobacteria bacterium]|nr:CDP-diacylglycerol--glycerol-3-phosphate 3-phosphatidyltransferase [Actinomycetota bacterium]
MANFLTMLRIAVTPAFVVLMLKSDSHPSFKYIALALFIFGAATDWADGFIARRTKTVSKFGVIADPLADRIFIGAALITLYIRGILPLLFLVIVLGRDILMALGYPVLGKIDPSKIAVHWTGKVATAILFVALGLLILTPSPSGNRLTLEGYQFFSWSSWQTYGLWLFIIGIFFSIISAGVYASRAVALIREGKGESPDEAGVSNEL